MKRKFLSFLAAIIFATGVGGAALTLTAPAPAYASAKCENRILTFPPWYRGLTGTHPQCNIKSPTELGGISTFIWKIGLNVLEIMLQLVGYVAVGYIIFGGYKYMTSVGSPDGMVKARQVITNAVIGLIISLFSVVVVTLVAGSV